MKPPPLPSLRALTAELRALHAAWSHPDAGGGEVCLCTRIGTDWAVRCVSDIEGEAHGHEFIPGSVERECGECEGQGGGPRAAWCDPCNGSGRVHAPQPFDAVAAARRLLAAARDGGVK